MYVCMYVYVFKAVREDLAQYCGRNTHTHTRFLIYQFS